MNKWIRRTAGSVGIAGGALLLGTAAHADTPMNVDPQALTNVADAANVDGGVSGLGVSVDTPGQRDTVGLLPDSGGPLRSGTNNGELGATVHAPTQGGQPRDIFANTGRTPDLFRSLPITDVVPMDGLGLPTGGSGGLAPGMASAPSRKPSPGRPAADRILPAPESAGRLEAGPLGQTGVPVRNLPLSTDMAGDTLGGGDALARDGLAGNGLGVPMGDRLPVGTVQGLAAQGTSALGGGSPLSGASPLGGGSALGGASPLGGGASPLGGGSALDGGSPLGGGGSALGGGGSALGGGSPLGGLPLGGLGGASDGADRDSRSQATPVVAGDAVHVLPPVGESFTEAGLPGSGDLPIFGSVLNGGTLPTRANLNTLPGAAPIPVHDLLAPGTAATGASTGAAYNNASGTVNGALSGGGTEALPLGGAETLPLGGAETLPLGSTDSLPVVGGLTGPRGTSGVPLDGVSNLPVVGGLASAGDGGGALGGALGGKHRKPLTGAQYLPRHSAQ